MYRYLFLHYIGQYLFSILFYIVLKKVYRSNFPINRIVGPIVVKSNDQTLKFSSSNNPFLISHFTDTHINTYNSSYAKNFKICLNGSLFYQPDVFLHTGDLADNFCTDDRPKYGHQCPNDYTIFSNIYSKYTQHFNYSFVSAGNHDMFGIYSFDSLNFNFLKTCSSLFNTPMNNYEEFLVSKYKIKLNGNLTVNFISLNPFTFPTAHPILMYYAHTWKSFLDRLENIVEKIPNNEKIIFYSHYPQSSFTSISNMPSSRQSSTGKTIGQLIERPNTIAFISGHFHPKKIMIEHHGFEKTVGEVITQNSQYIEVIGYDTKIKGLYDIITIDNERVVVHEIDPKNQQKCLITYPVPSNQTTTFSFINDKRAKLRMLCFDKKHLNIQIHGDIEGKTMRKVRKVKENVYLYEYPLFELFKNNENSELILNHLWFDGDWKGEIDFYSDGIIPQFKEPKNNEYSYALVIRVVLPILLFYLIFVTIPITTHSFKLLEQSYFDFLHKDSLNKHISRKNWFLTVSGFCLRLKIQRINKKYRWVLFIAVLWPIILPISLMETEGHYGFIWAYGYYIGDGFRYSEHGQDYVVYYYLYLIFPIVFASACLGADLPFYGAGGIEAFVMCIIGIFCVCKKIWYYNLSESAGPFCMFISVFALGLLVLYPLLFYFYYETFKNRGFRGPEWYSENLALVKSFSLQ